MAIRSITYEFWKSHIEYGNTYEITCAITLSWEKLIDMIESMINDGVFDDSEKMLSLYHSLDRIKDKYGERSVVRAVSMGAKTIGRMVDEKLTLEGLFSIVLYAKVKRNDDIPCMILKTYQLRYEF